MLSIRENATLQDARDDLLDFILAPTNWVGLGELAEGAAACPGQNPAYQRSVAGLSICASVDVTPALGVFLRIAFRAKSLSPLKAAEHLEGFLGPRLPLLPNTEWQVEVDPQRWIHFIRRYAGEPLEA